MQKAYDEYIKSYWRTSEPDKDKWRSYIEARDEVVSDVIGKYGNKKVKHIEAMHKTTVEDIVKSSTEYLRAPVGYYKK